MRDSPACEIRRELAGDVLSRKLYHHNGEGIFKAKEEVRIHTRIISGRAWWGTR